MPEENPLVSAMLKFIDWDKEHSEIKATTRSGESAIKLMKCLGIEEDDISVLIV